MRQLPNYGDDRNRGFCVHCGGPDETRDHNPSKAFLDAPLPENLPVAPSCRACNASFSLDEEYVACLLECVISGDTDPAGFERPGVAKTLANNPRLRTLFDTARQEADGQVIWRHDAARVERVIVKLARGHAAFELNEPQLAKPNEVWIRPLLTLNGEERDRFEGMPGEFALWPEVGSRAMHRLLICGDEAFEEGWLVVQQNRYRYRTSQRDGLRVSIVLREYLACEVVWD